MHPARAAQWSPGGRGAPPWSAPHLDLRPPALAKNFYDGGGNLRFRHVVEPYLTYRKIGGVSEFDRVIRFDEVDAVADTDEIEYGVTNRFFLRRST